MKLHHSFLSFAISIILLLPSATQARSAPDGFSDLVETLMPAVVNISSSQKPPEKTAPDSSARQLPPGSPLEEFREFFDKMNPENTPEEMPASLGSGFIIAPSGYIATNNHVIADAEEITVILSNDTQYQAKIIGRDAKTDLALLKVNAPEALPYVKFGNSDTARVGDWVIAIGNPFGLGGSVSAGIISARARDINAGPFDDFLQTDAAINRGNSGGPMFNTKGEVIGINTAIFSPSGGSVGIGFAVPASLASPIFTQLMEKGAVERGWLGVKLQEISKEIADSIGLKEPTGALVVEVTKDSPADKAGIVAGDVILRFNDQPVTEMRKLPRMVAGTKIGSNIKISLLHKGKETATDIVIGNLEEGKEASSLLVEGKEVETLPEGAKEMIGLTVVQLDETTRSRYDISPAINGLLVLKVGNKDIALSKEILPGDVIVSSNQDPVNDINAFLKTLTEAKVEGRSSVLLLISREGELRFTALPISNN